MTTQHAEFIFKQVINAMQEAEELGGPEGTEYIQLMDKIILEVTTRKINVQILLSSSVLTQ